MTRICDYEGSRYRSDFWEKGGRRYEDLAERIALKKMLPPQSKRKGKRIIEIGAGFGRVVDLYDGYEQIVLLDYARTQLEEAQQYLGQDNRFTFVVADVYNLPFVDNLFDTQVMIRVMHHLTDVPAALKELHRITKPAGTNIIEYANKRHLKSIFRWFLGGQDWNPFDLTPYEFVELNIDFHPTWMHQQFANVGFTIQAIRALSYYRLPLLKKIIPHSLLASLDGLTQPTGRWWQYAPSIFLKASPQQKAQGDTNGFFKCPHCHNQNLEEAESYLLCLKCKQRWEYKGGIYNFKTPLSGSM